mgnify:CR=1 FL=1
MPCERHRHKSTAICQNECPAEPEERERGSGVAGGERRGEVAVVEAHAQRPQRAAVQREEQEREEEQAHRRELEQ